MNRQMSLAKIMLTVSLPLICILLSNNCANKVSGDPESKSKHQRLEMLGNLLEIHVSITPPGFQPSLPDPIIILKQFEPIPPDKPESAEKVIEFLPAVNYWRMGRSDEVITTINNLKIQDDIVYRFLMDAYMKLDSNEKAIEFGDKIHEKDSQITTALGIWALRAHHFDRVIDSLSVKGRYDLWRFGN